MQTMNGELKQAVEALCKALAEDKAEGSYYYAWQANIAMAFKDEYDQSANLDELYPHQKSHINIHEIANNAAKNFLDMLIKSPSNE